jgi:hypothetical protein
MISDEDGGVPWERRVTSQNVNSAASSGNVGGFAAPVENHPLVKSLRSILKQIEEQYERELQSLITALPNTSVKDGALATLEPCYHERRENSLRELAAVLEGM